MKDEREQQFDEKFHSKEQEVGQVGNKIFSKFCLITIFFLTPRNWCLLAFFYSDLSQFMTKDCP